MYPKLIFILIHVLWRMDLALSTRLGWGWVPSVTRGKNWFELSRAGIVLRTAHAIETAKCISGTLGTTTERPAYMQPQPQRIRFTVMQQHHNMTYDINIYTPIPGTERYPCGQRFKSWVQIPPTKRYPGSSSPRFNWLYFGCNIS